MKEDGWNARYYNFSLTYSNQVNAAWDISPSIAKVTIGGSTVLDLTTNYDGTLSFVSDNTDIATVSYNTSNKKITVNGIAAGSTTISVTGDATETFNAIDETIVVLVRKDLATNCIMYESFDENDEVGGNDGEWKDIAITPTPIFDLEGWTYSTAYGASKCVRIGKNGWFLSPALGVTGDVTLKFVTESWGTDGSNGYVDIVGGGTFDDSESINGVTIQTVDGAKTRAKVTLKKTGTWTEYTLKIIGVTADSQIKFLGPKDKRIFFDEVEVLLDKTLATVTAAGWATWVAPVNVTVPSGVEAYAVSLSGTHTELNALEAIPAGTPVLLKNEGTYEFPVATETPAAVTTALLVSDGTITSADNAFVLANKEQGVGFYRWIGNSDSPAIPAGKVYLVYTGTSAPDFIDFGDATGIRMVNDSGFMVNGSETYNLNGQRVAQPTKGLYIVNGKKVIIK